MKNKEVLRGVKQGVVFWFFAISCLTLKAEYYNVDKEIDGEYQIEASHHNGGAEQVVYNILVPAGTVAHVSVSGTTSSSDTCSRRSAYLIFSSDGEKHNFGGSVDGATFTTTFTETSQVALYVTASPDQYPRNDSYWNPITESVVPKITYVTYSAYSCQLKYKLTVKYEKAQAPVYTVRYEPGTFGAGSAQMSQKTLGVDLVLMDVLFSRTGYQQIGWSRSKEGSTFDFLLGEVYDADASLTVYPYWVRASATAVPVSLDIRGGDSVYPGESLNLICEAKYSDGTKRVVSPFWQISSGAHIATISSNGVLNASAFADGDVAVKAIFLENGVAIVKTLTVTIKSDSTRIVVDIPSTGAGSSSSEEFDASLTRVWYFDLSQRPEWVTDLFVYIASGRYKDIAYGLNSSQMKGCALSGTAILVIHALANDTGFGRSWSFTAEDSLGNVLKTIVFRQSSTPGVALTSLSIIGSRNLQSDDRAVCRCEATFSDGTVSPVSPRWSVVSGEAFVELDVNGVVTAKSVTSQQSVTISASYGGLEKSFVMTVNPKVSGDPTMSDGTVKDVAPGSVITLPAKKGTQGGGRFVGWSDGKKTYAAGAEYTVPVTGVKLTAVYEPFWLFPEESTVMRPDEEAPYATAAAVYDGYLRNAAGKVFGSVQVKVAKGKADRATGALSSKVTVTVQLADGTKKLSFKGGFADAKGAVTTMEVGGHTLALTLGAYGLGGTFDGKWFVDGARNLFSSKAVADKAVAASVLDRWRGSYNLVSGDTILGVTVGTKGKVKIAGTVSGVKVSATSQLLIGENGVRCAPVVIFKKANLGFAVWLTDDGSSVAGLGDALAGPAGAISNSAKFRCADGKAALKPALAGIGATLLSGYLPDGLSVAPSGTKWIVAGGAKAGRVAFVRGKTTVDETKAGANPSGLKLTYKSKDGSFKGSFKAYGVLNGKIKAYTVNVTGILVEGVGYGTATVKKPAASFPIIIE